MTIKFRNVSVVFRKYNDGFPSLKSFVTGIFKSNGVKKFTLHKSLDGVDLTISDGERIGIIGHNGAGKSTLLKTIVGIYKPNGGVLTVEGRVAPLLEIGSGFHPELTGRENLRLNCALLGMTEEETAQKETEIIAFSGLEAFIDSQVKYYSTGMNLRLGFSISASAEPDILIIDEFFAGGDQEFIKKSSDKLRQLIKTSRILILVSHELNYIREFCNRVIWIDHGKIRMDGNPELVLQEYLASSS